MSRPRIFPLYYIVLLLLPALSGCQQSGSLYSNFRDVADLQPVQTLGYDRRGDSVTLSVSSGRGTETLPTAMLRGSGRSLSEAMDAVQDYSAREDLFFAHIRYVVVGEAAARRGLGELLDWFERTPQTRLDVPLFIVEGDEAASLFSDSGDEQEITSVLLSLQRDAERQGLSVCYTLSDVARQLSEAGCALCCSVRSVTPGEHVPAAPEGRTALESGFALLQGDALTDFTGEDAARGLCLLLNKAALSRAELSDGQGGHATVELDSCRCRCRAAFSSDGAPTLTVSLRCRAGILEVVSHMDSDALHRALDASLDSWVVERLRAAVLFMEKNGADLLSLRSQLLRADPSYGGGGDFPDGLRVLLRTDARLERSYDLSAAENLHEEEA